MSFDVFIYFPLGLSLFESTCLLIFFSFELVVSILVFEGLMLVFFLGGGIKRRSSSVFWGEEKKGHVRQSRVLFSVFLVLGAGRITCCV